MKTLLALLLMAMPALAGQTYRVTCTEPGCWRTFDAKPYTITTLISRSTVGGFEQERAMWFQCPNPDCKAKVRVVYTVFIPESLAVPVKRMPKPAPKKSSWFKWSGPRYCSPADRERLGEKWARGE